MRIAFVHLLLAIEMDADVMWGVEFFFVWAGECVENNI
jgi:hypothetical protein